MAGFRVIIQAQDESHDGHAVPDSKMNPRMREDIADGNRVYVICPGWMPSKLQPHQFYWPSDASCDWGSFLNQVVQFMYQRGCLVTGKAHEICLLNALRDAPQILSPKSSLGIYVFLHQPTVIIQPEGPSSKQIPNTLPSYVRWFTVSGGLVAENRIQGQQSAK
ncbi:hypothetical protein B0T21DRAFT_344496 [Apiosordaria backusii]|uniref:Uncharacterized protein n=1 Tax=Apiosordaria backusii TaxID=314023 RepID=A0AA40K379_9PEZI|nr:hypothetical protein B0T21DRAFT_344496 [Apiosordaria backusii]